MCLVVFDSTDDGSGRCRRATANDPLRSFTGLLPMAAVHPGAEIRGLRRVPDACREVDID